MLHEVSLQTLIKRGFQEHRFLEADDTRKVRRYIADGFHYQSPWEIGITLGFFAQTFGARAPLDWIAHQLFHDGIRAKTINDDVVQLDYAHGHTEIVDFQYLVDLDDGINTCLYDWGLTEPELILDYEEFDEWRAVTEDSMIDDLIGFWETWHDVDCDGTVIELSAEEELSWNEAMEALLDRHKKQRAAIEAGAVKIGL